MAFVDETGDVGDPKKGGASSCYALGCLVVKLEGWSDAFGKVLEMRRQMRSSFGIRLRDELKANYLIRGSGPLRDLSLSPSQRQYIYRAHLRTVSEMDGRAFAVVVDKERTGSAGPECFQMAWETLLQRLERTSYYDKEHMLIVHDDGENDAVRSAVRRARRYLTAGSALQPGRLRVDAKWFVDDPIPRNSQHSYLIQMADLVAYAGWRSYMPPSKVVAAVVPGSMWSQLGEGVHAKVNSFQLNGSVPGVVLRK